MAGTELAVGYVSLVPSGRGFGRSIIREASSAGSLAGDSASRNFGSRFVSGMGQVGKRAAIALTAGLGTAAFFGVKTAANFEQTRIAFEGILGDVDKANRLLGELRDFAARTPFEFTGLADSARSLLAVGFAADEIIPTMTTLGNVAATLGVGEAEIKGVVRALGQMRGKGKASAEELQQISEQIPGFSAITVIAKELGIKTSEAFEEMAKGAISADVAIEAILAGMEEFPGAAGAMDRQSKTLNGVLSTFKDTLAGIAIDFITPHLPAMSRAVESAGGMLGSFFEGLQTGFTEGQTGAEAFGGRVADAFGVLGTFVRDSVVPAIASIGTFARDTVAPAVASIVTSGLDFVKQWWDDNGETVKQVASDVFGSIVGWSTAIGTVITETLVPALASFGGWFLDEGPGVEIIISGIAGALAVYAFNAGLAAAATIAATWPLLVFALAVGTLTWATNELVDKLNLLEGAVTVFAWMRANVVEPLLRSIRRSVDAMNELIDLFAELPDLPGGKGVLGVDIIDFSVRDLLEGRAGGGPVTAGMPYVVGERRPELFVPDQNGTILPSVPGGPMVGVLNVTQAPGEDPTVTTMRALRKTRLLAAA